MITTWGWGAQGGVISVMGWGGTRQDDLGELTATLVSTNDLTGTLVSTAELVGTLVTK